MSRACSIAVGHAVDVVGVDVQGLGHLVGGAGELAEHEHAVAVGAGRGELLGDEVHAVAQRRHEHDVGGAVQADQLGLREAAVQVVDRRAVEGRPAAVDRADGLLDAGAELLVGVDLLARGHGDLQDAQLAAQVGSALSTRSTAIRRRRMPLV
jgi:hypothetical protein